MNSPLEVRASFDEWLKCERLATRFQPIFESDADRFRLHAVEGFCRGPDERFAEGDAASFFDEARRLGYQVALDHVCLASIIASSAAIPRLDCRVALNVDPATLGSGKAFLDHLRSLLDSAGIGLDRVILELVERADSLAREPMSAFLDPFRALGGSIAIDDLGQGSSNFSSVLDFRPDYLKIDGYVVAGVSRDARRRAVVETCVLLADRIGSSLIAEGVENVEDLRVLQSLGLSMFQGYLFARPTTAERLSLSDRILPKSFGYLRSVDRAEPPTVRGGA